MTNKNLKIMNLQYLIDKGVTSLSVKDGKSSIKAIDTNWIDFTDINTLLGLEFDVIDIPDGVYEISEVEEIKQMFNYSTNAWMDDCFLDCDEATTRTILRLNPVKRKETVYYSNIYKAGSGEMYSSKLFLSKVTAKADSLKYRGCFIKTVEVRL